jgi:hypothetical protein
MSTQVIVGISSSMMEVRLIFTSILKFFSLLLLGKPSQVEKEKAKRIVLQLTEELPNGLGIVCDNGYTSFDTAVELFSKKRLYLERFGKIEKKYRQFCCLQKQNKLKVH